MHADSIKVHPAPPLGNSGRNSRGRHLLTLGPSTIWHTRTIRLLLPCYFREFGILKLYAALRFGDGDLRHSWRHKFGREGFPPAISMVQKLQSLDSIKPSHKWGSGGHDVQSCRPEPIKTKALAPEGLRPAAPDYL